MSDHLFTATTNQISHLADIFTSIAIVNNQALIFLSNDGITIVCEHNHICNVTARIDKSLFSTYIFCGENGPQNGELNDEVNGEIKSIGVDISTISDSINVMNNSNLNKISCTLSYNGQGHPFVVSFEDDKMNEKVEFSTFYLDMDPYGLDLNYEEIRFEILLKSGVFYNLLRDLRDYNTDELYIHLSNMDDKNQLNFISKGELGYSKLIFPNEKTILERVCIWKKNAMSDMILTNSSLMSIYNFNILSKILKMVKLSSKCKLQKDLNGILSIDLLCKNPDLIAYNGTIIKFNLLELINDDTNMDYLEDEVGYIEQDENEVIQPIVDNRNTIIEVPLFL